MRTGIATASATGARVYGTAATRARPSARSPNRAGRARAALRIATLPWIAGAYFLVLGTSLLILSPGTLIVPVGLPWLRGAVTAASGLVLLWLAGVAARRTVVCGLYVLVALPQLAYGLQFIRRGTYAPGATLVWFALGLLVAAAIYWRRAEFASSLPADDRRQRGEFRPSLHHAPRSRRLCPCRIRVHPGAGQSPAAGRSRVASATIGPEATILGVLFVAGGIVLALAQVLTRLPLGSALGRARFRWPGPARHVGAIFREWRSRALAARLVLAGDRRGGRAPAVHWPPRGAARPPLLLPSPRLISRHSHNGPAAHRDDGDGELRFDGHHPGRSPGRIQRHHRNGRNLRSRRRVAGFAPGPPS